MSQADPRSRFDAALIHGMRDRLADTYARFRKQERAVIAAAAPTASTEYRERDCPGCDAPARGVRPVLQAHGLDLIECPRCGITYSRQVMNEAIDADRYRASELDVAAMRLRCSGPYLELETARAQYYLDRLHVTGAITGSLLEVGCGTGTLLVEAMKRGWSALGVEPGAAAAAVARERGANVTEGYFPRDLPQGTGHFEVVAALDVLEHFATPRDFLRVLRDHLAPGGRLLLQVPNWDSLLVRLEGAASSTVCPGHWTYFTPVTLTRMAEAEGFSPLLVETVISEMDRIAVFGDAAIEDCIRRLRPDATGAALNADRLHALQLGYKILGIFAAG
jgi:SAM-dependent methyltransferase